MKVILISVLLYVVVVSTNATTDVCIIGGGIGGAAVAYYLRDNYPGGSIRVFEKNDYIGGRLKHVIVDGFVAEVGGDAWSSANKYIVNIVKKLGLNTEKKERDIFGDPLSKNLGVWDGSSLLNADALVIEHILSDVRGILEEADFLLHLNKNYNTRGNGTSFASIDEFLLPGDLNRYTSIASSVFFQERSVSNVTQTKLLEPLLRCIYGQGLSAHVFASLVALTSMVGAASVAEGNSVLVERMLEYSGADVELGTPVRSVERRQEDDESSFVLRTDDGTNATETCRAVVLAAPIEYANIDWIGIDVSDTKKRKFVECYVTLVRATGIDATYFGRQRASDDVPFNIFTTASADAPFTVLQFESELPDDQGVLYKFFAPHAIPANVLDRIFTNVLSVTVQHWDYTFPILSPHAVNKGTYQAITPAGPVRLYYLNAMESVASAMEGSIIAGRNIAMLLAAVL